MPPGLKDNRSNGRRPQGVRRSLPWPLRPAWHPSPPWPGPNNSWLWRLDCRIIPYQDKSRSRILGPDENEPALSTPDDLLRRWNAGVGRIRPSWQPVEVGTETIPSRLSVIRRVLSPTTGQGCLSPAGCDIPPIPRWWATIEDGRKFLIVGNGTANTDGVSRAEPGDGCLTGRGDPDRSSRFFLSHKPITIFDAPIPARSSLVWRTMRPRRMLSPFARRKEDNRRGLKITAPHPSEVRSKARKAGHNFLAHCTCPCYNIGDSHG